MQDQPSFLVLDATLVLIAVYLLTIFHPGLFFPQMRNGYAKEMAKANSTDAERDGESDETKNEATGAANNRRKVEQPA